MFLFHSSDRPAFIWLHDWGSDLFLKDDLTGNSFSVTIYQVEQIKNRKKKLESYKSIAESLSLKKSVPIEGKVQKHRQSTYCKLQLSHFTFLKEANVNLQSGSRQITTFHCIGKEDLIWHRCVIQWCFIRGVRILGFLLFLSMKYLPYDVQSSA